MVEYKIPSFIFDKIWRSKWATRKDVEKILGKKIKFNGKKVLDFDVAPVPIPFSLTQKDTLE